MAISILLVRALVEGIARHGVSLDAFLRAGGLDVAALEDGDARISLDAYHALVERALALSGDDALGLHMGEEASPTTYSVMAHLVAHAPTLRSAADALTRYQALLLDRPVFALREDGPTAYLVYDVPEAPPACRRFHAEITMTGLHRMVMFFGRGAMPRSVSFEHPAPSYRGEYARLFEGRERFAQAVTQIEFDRGLLDLPQLHADPELHGALETQAQRRLSRQSARTTYAERVLEFLVERATAANRDMAGAARGLGLSVRSLRRRLADEGTAFMDLATRAQVTLAKRLLADTGRSVDEVASQLGFSDRTAFSRAFKRWTRTTPGEYRRRGHGGDPPLTSRTPADPPRRTARSPRR